MRIELILKRMSYRNRLMFTSVAAVCFLFYNILFKHLRTKLNHKKIEFVDPLLTVGTLHVRIDNGWKTDSGGQTGVKPLKHRISSLIVIYLLPSMALFYRIVGFYQRIYMIFIVWSKKLLSFSFMYVWNLTITIYNVLLSNFWTISNYTKLILVFHNLVMCYF